MTINEWLKTYHTMIICPVGCNKATGFLLTNNMKIFFKEGKLNNESKRILTNKRRKESST